MLVPQYPQLLSPFRGHRAAPLIIFIPKTAVMAKRYDYYLLESSDKEEFYAGVDNLLMDGWELHGHLVAFPESTVDGKVETVRYIQAFVKAAGERRSTGFNMGR